MSRSQLGTLPALNICVESASWGVERAMRAGFETKQFIKFMCVHFGRIINCDRICIEFRVDKFYQHKLFGCDIKIHKIHI